MARRDSDKALFRFLAVLLTACGFILCFPAPAHAYVGPGAGFAVLSSFLALFLAFLNALVAVLTWPVRQMFRLLRRRRAYRKARVKRVVILGFDGMDPGLASRFIEEGKLPHLARLQVEGTFLPLATTVPPISPVAWSSFLTGLNPGKHNIYDFLAPDRKLYLPYLSSAQIRGPRRTIRVGKYAIPLGRPRIKRLRHGIPFWHALAKAGVPCSVIRVPVTFPPEKFPGVLLSGMCVPDVRGTQGTFSFHTTRELGAEKLIGGVCIPIEKADGAFRSYVPGPENSLRPDTKEELRVPFTVRVDPGRSAAHFEVDHQRFALKEGEYSEWIELKFRAGLGVRVCGICRFYLKEASSHLEVYVTPVNIDPVKPALPVSQPLAYSIYLAKRFGLFATLGLAEDTWGLNEGFLDDEAFLQQCYLIHAEREKMFFDALDKTSRGLCVCVFDITDRVQHMFWRYLARDHPAARGAPVSGSSAAIIEELYRRMDELVGRARKKMGRDSLLLVVSDHGFKSFARGVNLNSWLHRNGYLALRDDATGGDWFQNVNWQRTQAYALGLNGVFINQAGRERYGIVNPGREKRALMRELREKLQGLMDPGKGAVAILRIYESPNSYRGPYVENAPDLVVGFAEGYRASWDSVQGRVTPVIFEDNTKAWSGDHCIDAALVPGVLFSNWKIRCERPAIVDVAPTVLELFGMPLPSNLDGKPWELHPPS